MNIIFFEDKSWEQLLPLTYTKPACELRTGILTLREKWQYMFPGATFSHLTKPYLSEKYPQKSGDRDLYICGAALPNPSLKDSLAALNDNQGLIFENRILGFKSSKPVSCPVESDNLPEISFKEYSSEISFLNHPWDLFKINGEQIEKDLEILQLNPSYGSLSKTNNILGNNLFVEEGVKAEFATINTETGPVYLGKNSELMEGSVIRGPFALCENSVVKMSAKIYGPTTIGPNCKVGGEINNVVFQSFSNKAHDGFLGNSVIGEWCNLGADSNNSNLKNNYAEVKLWSYPDNRFIRTGLQFCGLIMGDHSKCGINTMFNTGTVVGVNANIFGSGFPRNFIPSFSWGGAHGFKTYTTPKAFEVARLVMQRRGLEFDAAEEALLNEVFRLTEKYRT